MPRDNFMLLRQMRMRDQPTSTLGMQRAALNIGRPPGPNTNDQVGQRPQIQQGRPARPVAGQRAPTPNTPPMRQPSPPIQMGAQPAAGTPWQQQGVARTAEDANGGRFYQNGTTWWSGSQPQNQNYDPAAMRIGNIGAGIPASAAEQRFPQQPQRQLGVDSAGNIVPNVSRALPVQYTEGSGTSSTPPAGLKDTRGKRGSSKPPSGFATGTSSSGLAVGPESGGNGNTDDTPATSSAEALTLTSNGFNIETDGTITREVDGKTIEEGNINDPSSWSDIVKNVLGGYDKNNPFEGSKPGSDYQTQRENQQDSGGNTTPQTVADFLRQLGLGLPPQMDRSVIDRLNSSIAQRYARQQGRALQAQSEMGARAGASADQMAGAAGDVTSQYGLASAEEQNRNELQLQVQNFQQQTDYYNKQFQIAMSLFADAQSDQDRDLAFAHAQKMLQLGTDAQKELIAYQNELANQITWKDILGGLLGAGSQIGGMALGGYMGGLGGGGGGGGGSSYYTPQSRRTYGGGGTSINLRGY